jgi:hypothetical protein
MPNFLPNNQDSTAYKELEGVLLRQNYFEKWHIFRGWKHGCKNAIITHICIAKGVRK